MMATCPKTSENAIEKSGTKWRHKAIEFTGLASYQESSSLRSYSLMPLSCSGTTDNILFAQSHWEDTDCIFPSVFICQNTVTAALRYRLSDVRFLKRWGACLSRILVSHVGVVESVGNQTLYTNHDFVL